MEQLLHRLEQLRARRSMNQLATDVQMPRHTVVNLYRGQGTLSSLHRFADALDHCVTLDVEGTEIEGYSLGDQLRMVRRDSGMTLKGAAAKAGITETTAARIENDTDCYTRVICAYAAAIGVALILTTSDEIQLRFARRDLSDWMDHAKLPLHAIDGIFIPFDLIDYALQTRVEKLERKVRH